VCVSLPLSLSLCQGSGPWSSWRRTSSPGTRAWCSSPGPSTTPSRPCWTNPLPSRMSLWSCSTLAQFFLSVLLLVEVALLILVRDTRVSRAMWVTHFPHVYPRYEVNFQDGIDCGGAYIKLLSDTPGLNLVSTCVISVYIVVFTLQDTRIVKVLCVTNLLY